MKPSSKRGEAGSTRVPGPAAMRPFSAMRYATLEVDERRADRDDVESKPTPAAVSSRRSAFEPASGSGAGTAASTGANGVAAWRVWLRDEAGRPLALADAQRRIVCLLFRPESLLSDPEALDVLRVALAFAAAPPRR